VQIHSEADAVAWLAKQSCACGRRQLGRDPVLVDDGGALVLRYAGCSSCHEPAYYDARLPDELQARAAQIAGSTRVLEPELIAVLAPWVATAFPRYAPSRTAALESSADSLGLVASLRPDWSISEWLRGSLGYGQARCLRSDGVRAIATFTRPQTQPLERVTSKLKLTALGVAPMLDIRTAGDYSVLFEQEPTGLPLSTAMFPLHVDQAALLFGKLLAIVADAHARGELLRGVRPETIYIAHDLVVSVVPRGELFAGGAQQSKDLNPTYPFPAIYQAPDTMSGKPTPASDVFSCCAVLLFALTRKTPYDAPSPTWQLGAMMSGPPPLPAGLDSRLAELVSAGLDPDPAKRPTALELASVLAAS
jgi:hypothetical protein